MPESLRHARHGRDKLLAYLQLVRAPNVFTAAADVTTGYLFVNGTLEPLPLFLCLLIASCLLYAAGMVLNDVYDVDVDARQRPQRPLPSGRISASWAKWLGFELLLLGAVLAWLSGYLYPGFAAVPYRPGLVATLLALSVVAYDAALKYTPLGCLAMGACRMFNLLLGMSAARVMAGGAEEGPATLGFTSAQLAAAVGIGVYITGVTWFARREAQAGHRWQLAAATAVMLGGIAVLAALPSFSGIEPRFAAIDMWRLLLGLLALVIARRCLMAVVQPVPERMQAAVKLAIMSLIVLDAAICLLVAGPLWALAVLALLVPANLLGRWIYST